MTSAPMITWKRGDTFEVDCVYEHPDTGLPADLDGITIASQLRMPKGNVLISDAVVTIGSPTTSGAFRVVVADTDEWPIGTLEFDIQFSLAGGSIISSETLLVHVIRDVTQP